MGRIGLGLVGELQESLADLSIMAGLPPVRGAELSLEGDSFSSVPASLDSGELTLGPPHHEQPVSDRGRLWRFRTDTRERGHPPGALGKSQSSAGLRQLRFGHRASASVCTDVPGDPGCLVRPAGSCSDDDWTRSRSVRPQP
jgi:hypothetical protein